MVFSIPYDTIGYGEATQNNGFAGVTAKSPAGIGYSLSGDTITLKDIPNPYLNRFGATSDTKPAGCQIIPTNSNSGKAYGGPAALEMVPHGIMDLIDHPIKLMQNDILTSRVNNTNVNEGTVLFADITYGMKARRWTLAEFAAAKLYLEPATVTSGADVTDQSGNVTIYASCDNTVNWWDTDGQYYILGISSAVGIAASGGFLQIINLSGVWKGYMPGIPNNCLSDVVFSPNQEKTLALSPIGPISGRALKNSVEVGALHTTAGALTFNWILARTR